MMIQPGSPEQWILASLTLGIIIFKVVLLIVLLAKFNTKRREQGIVALYFLKAVIILFLCLAISRSLALTFDFFLTYLDMDLYVVGYNIYFWKLAMVISNIGNLAVLYTLDTKVLGKKLKYIPEIIMAVGLVVILFFPVSEKPDFVLLSQILIVAMAVSAIIPLVFLYLGIKIPGLRKTAFLIFFGILIYIGAGLLVNGNTLDSIIKSSGVSIVVVYTLYLVIKLAGLSILAYGTTKFKLS
nr:hypothetical protein [Candidatus Sigynarchaeum springense]